MEQKPSKLTYDEDVPTYLDVECNYIRNGSTLIKTQLWALEYIGKIEEYLSSKKTIALGMDVKKRVGHFWLASAA